MTKVGGGLYVDVVTSYFVILGSSDVCQVRYPGSFWSATGSSVLKLLVPSTGSLRLRK